MLAASDNPYRSEGMPFRPWTSGALLFGALALTLSACSSDTVSPSDNTAPTGITATPPARNRRATTAP